MGVKVKPGKKPPKSGEYKPIGPRGGRVNAPDVTIEGNEGHMPPTQKKGQKWERKGPAKRN